SADGKVFAVSVGDNLVRLLDPLTGKELGRIQGGQEPFHCVAFSPQGNLVAAGGFDSSIRMWEVKSSKEIGTLSVERRGVRAVAFVLASNRKEELGDRELEELWTRMADEDAEDAYEALCQLARHPREAVAFLGVKLQPTTSAQVKKWLSDLDEEEFAVRQAAE